MGRYLDGYGPEDMALPEVKLVQNVGGEQAKQCGATPGDFFLSLNDEVIPGSEGLDIVVVDIQKTRTYWGRTDIEDSPPECSGRDANSGLSDNGDKCSECPHRNDAPWLLDRDERRKVCTVDYNIMGIRISDYMPMIIRAGGISALAAKELITQLKLNKEIKGAYHKAKIHISSLPKKTSAGDAFAIRFKLTELVPDEEAKELADQSNRLLGEPELEPIGFLPDGTAFYTEEEKQRLTAETAVKAEPAQPEPAKQLEPAPKQEAPKPEPEPKKVETKEPGKDPIDYEF
ncbi:MAG: hypothetical protein KKD44_26775 [Proteobacteria bacterium]|nr:hypothetical protein [Pseudomonadota bacterium]